MTAIHPGDIVRRATWPAGMYVVVKEVIPDLGVRGQWHVMDRPSGSPVCFFSYRPCGVSMPFQVIGVDS